jgi:ribonuclease D
MSAADRSPAKPVTFDLIRGEADLRALAAKLRTMAAIAVDTESNSLYAYRERVCLIQFSSAEQDFLVDPLAFQDLSALGPVFGDPQIEKVFHAAEYDLLCLRRDFGFETVNLFDTMVAARILGRIEIGLGSLLNAEFGVTLEKRYQRANWGQRPLPDYLLDYARLDTHYLLALRERLGAELEQRSLMALAQEDFRRLAANNHETSWGIPGTDRPVDCWRISGSYDLDPQQAAILLELCRYRDQTARQLDRPLFKVLSDQTLIAIAINQPKTLEELERLPGMGGGKASRGRSNRGSQMRRHGQHLLNAVQRGLEAKQVHPPRSKRPDPTISERLDALRNWRKTAAAQMGVPSDVVLPRDLMQALAYQNPRSQADLEAALKTVPWRLEHFGQQILEALNSH